MLFNSFEFLYFFLPITWLGYFSLQHARLSRVARGWLLLCSLVFYSWWNIRYLPIFLASITINYLLSYGMRKQPGSRRSFSLLVAGITANTALLLYYKYSDFFISTVNLALKNEIPLLHLALPLAISFFTIQQVVYLVDSYQGAAANAPFADYALFVTFFPHLIAGPIVQHRELIPQFHEQRRYPVNYFKLWSGISIMAVGLLKKILIADTFAIWAKQGFDGAASLSFFSAWAASLSYTFQLYFDFSGYSDMAIGIALLFNLEMPSNFRSPYRARNMIQFWQTWHITLSRFITDYLYTPILRSLPIINFRNSLFAILLAMLIAGMWHGANWTFIVFGLLHGIGLVANHLMKKRKMKLPYFWAWAFTFFWVNFAFVFFRAKNGEAVETMLRGMFVPSSLYLPSIQPWLMLCIGFFIVLKLPTTEEFFRKKYVSGIRSSFLTAILIFVALLVLEFQNANEFLYFKF